VQSSPLHKSGRLLIVHVFIFIQAADRRGSDKLMLGMFAIKSNSNRRKTVGETAYNKPSCSIDLAGGVMERIPNQ
jgi:hypothetical protein